MDNSKQLASLIGPTIIALTMTEMFNAHIWINVSPTQTYLAGSLWFIAGLSIIRSHNSWTVGWTVLITIIGWFALLGGLGRMIFPESFQKNSENSSVVFIFQIVLLTVGIILSFMAYFRVHNKT